MRETSIVAPPIDTHPSVPLRLRSALSQVTALDVAAFLLPALAFLEVQLVGRLIISELAALALLPWLLRTRDRLQVPRWLIALWAAWLVSQVVTDLVVGSAFTDWARGWAAIVMTLIDILAVTALAATPRRARIFALGLGTGIVLGFAVEPIRLIPVDMWKWVWAGPVAYAIGAVVSGRLGVDRPWIAVLAFGAFGWLNAALLFRSLGGVALLTAVYLLVGIVASRRARGLPEGRRVVAGIVGYGAAGVAVFLAINIASSMNVLGDLAKERYDLQSGANATESAAPTTAPGAGGPNPVETVAPVGPISAIAPGSPLAVLLGGRAEMFASPIAILESPIIGHGSWAKDPRYAALQRQGLEDLGVVERSLFVDPNLIPTHSFLLGSWVWAGLAGALFWIGVAVAALRLMGTMYAVRLAVSPLIVFATTTLLWDIAFSPYGNAARLYAAFGIAMVLLGLRLVDGARANERANSAA